MRESRGVKPYGEMKMITWDSSLRTHHGPIPVACNGVEEERTGCDPKDGELYLSRTKSEETLMEVRIGSDVQIDR